MFEYLLGHFSASSWANAAQRHTRAAQQRTDQAYYDQIRARQQQVSKARQQQASKAESPDRFDTMKVAEPVEESAKALPGPLSK